VNPTLPPTVRETVAGYLADADRMLPGAVAGFYVVGSVAMDAYRRRRSDIDFVAVVDGKGDDRTLHMLRLLHARSGWRTAVIAVGQGRSPLTGTLNGVFVRSDEVTRPVTVLEPLASQTGATFRVGAAGSDVSPVAWKVLAERGIAVRGPHPSILGVDPQPDLLRPWTRGNLESYWRPWAAAVRRRPQLFAWRPRWATAWGVLGVCRLHCTIATGEVVSKEAAGEYGLGALAPAWHPVLREALAYWREQPVALRAGPRRRARMTSDLILHVIDDCDRLPAAPPPHPRPGG
jgi:hypothetical protein